jgi:hypothetical protein
MPPLHSKARRAGPRDFLYFQTPSLWKAYPFLPLIRRIEGHVDCGVLYDAQEVSGLFGFRCTVFLTNLFTLPRVESTLLTGPRRVYDTFEELADDGWYVD